MKLKYFTETFIVLLIYFFNATFSHHSKEIGSLIQETEKHKDVTLKYIVPGYLTVKPEKPTKVQHLSDFVDKNDEKYRSFMERVEQGHTKKSLIFNIYDDNMRGATISLFKMLHLITTSEQFKKVNDWLIHNVNSEMYDYALRLFSLFNTKYKVMDIDPPFKNNPHHFVNSETIIKALKLSSNAEHLHLLDPIGNQIFIREHLTSINTNYSDWLSPHKDCKDRIDYFTEDVSLNSYYYGLSLLHPFWMSNQELDEHNPRHAEHYHFAHRQLISRYRLEEEHLKQSNRSQKDECKADYKPYLIHKNGLSFPVRSRMKGSIGDENSRIFSTDMAIKECIARAMIVMDNGTTIKLNEDNYVDLIAKLVRANYDSVRIAKKVRSLFGYGHSGHLIDEYNPSPSLLHHPETTLRDPAFWQVVEYMLNYFNNFGDTLEPLNLSQYETEEVRIVDASFSKLMTYFEYYTFAINKAVESDNSPMNSRSNNVIAARQKRLKHFPIVFNFTVESEYNRTIIMRLFIGPRCNFEECWNNFTSFYELDVRMLNLSEGLNLVTWTSERYSRYSYDDYFDMEHQFLSTTNNFSIFKFPENLILPRGLEKGLSLTLFVMFTSPEDRTQMDFLPHGSNHYINVCFEYDKKPLGFPFHRKASNYSSEVTNYKFYNITVYHKSRPIDETGYFSSHLY